jgi:hypothetical protein
MSRKKRTTRKKRARKLSEIIIAPSDDSFFEPEDISDDETDDVSGETNVHPPRLPAISSNPIIAALQRWLRRRGNIRATVLTDHKSTPEEMKRFIEKVFDDEAFREIATPMIEALLDGNQRFTNTVKQAIKNADSLFHRDRAKALLDKCAAIKEARSWTSASLQIRG